MSHYDLTKSRIIQWIGIILIIAVFAGAYWYFNVRAGVKQNTGGTQPQGTGDLSSGLAGYWKLDDGSGTTAVDSSTNANNGTLTNGPTWTTGQIGGAVDFDGTNDYISMTSIAATKVDSGQNFTISGRFNRDTFTSIHPIFVNKNTVTSAGDKGYGVYIDGTTDKLTLTISDLEADTYKLESSSTFTATGWHHFSVVWNDASASETKIYIDGVAEAATATGTFGNIGEFLGPATTKIGSDSNSGVFFDGKLDEIRFYNRALSADEVSQLYRLTTPTSVDTSLKGYWSFNGADMNGTTVYDRSGAGNTGTLTNGPSKTSGKVGQALSFDGTDDYVTVADASSLDVADSTNFTLSGWFSRSSFTTDDTILAKSNGQAASDTGYNVYIDDSTDKVTFVANDGTDQYKLESTSTFTATGWNHYSIVWDDSSSSQTKLYINGVAESATATGTFANVNSLANAVTLRMGTESDAGNPFDGKLDEARMYTRALSASEIQSLYDTGASDKVNSSVSQNQGTGRLDSGLAGYWKLDDGSGTTAVDSSTNANNGTLTNGPTWTTGQIGGAVDFDGTDDYVQVTNSQSLDFTTNYTLSAWIYPTLRDSFNPIFFRGTGDTDDIEVYTATSAGSQGLSILHNRGNGGTMEYSTSDFSSGTSGTGAWGQPALNTWTLLTITYANSDTLKVYYNGVQVGSTITGLTPPLDTNRPWRFGWVENTAFGANNHYNNGKIDEVRIYDRTLSADEVSQLYRLTTPTSVDTGLKGYWSFNGADMNGNTVLDRSGAGKYGDATNGPTKVPGKIGQALSFDGTNDYVVFPTSATGFDVGTTVSYAAWVKPTALPGSTAVIFEKLTGGTEQKGLYLNSTGKISFYLYYVSAGVTLYSNTVLAVNNWYYVVATYDGSTEKIYINGVLDASQAASGDVGDNNAMLQVGASNFGSSSFFSGVLDELRVYSRALSASEIKVLYDAGADDKTNSSVSQPQGTGRLDSGLAGYWKLDDGSGTTAVDSSTNGNNGTLTNGPTWTTGQIGGAVTFDGTDDFISAGLNIDNYPTLTLSAWVKKTADGAGLVFGNDNGSFDRGLSADSSGYWNVWAGNTNWVVSGASYSLNTWYHVAVVYEASDTVFYLNGTPYRRGSASSGYSGSSTFYIGKTQNDGRYYTGQIDEVRAYGRALSADEVAQLYRLTTPTGVDTSLKGYWSFNGKDLNGTTAYDRSGAGNNGTLTNGPTKAPGKIGQGLSFDGSNDYIVTPIVNLGYSSGTISWWQKPSTAYNSGTLRPSWGQVTSGSGPPEFSAQVFTDNNWYVGWDSSGDEDRVIIPASNANYPQNVWSYYTFTWVSGGDSVFYQNGTEIGRKTGGTTVYNLGSTNYWNIGWLGTLSYYFPGSIDEVRIYNRALSTTEITTLYNQGR